MLALPLTAAVLLQATPTQMGLLTAIEIAALRAAVAARGRLARPRAQAAGLRGRRAAASALAVASVPLAWWLGWLSMAWLYVVGFVLGCVHTVAGTAAQIVLTQVVPRERLVEAHAKNALATSGAEVAGPGLAGALIKLSARRWRCCVDARAAAAARRSILRGIRVHERRDAARTTRTSGATCEAGLRFVRGTPLLVTMARDGGRLADVPSRRDGGADPLRHAHAGLERAQTWACASSAWASAPSPASVLGPPHLGAHRPRALPGAGLGRLRRRLAAAGRGAGQRLRRRPCSR